MLTNTASIILLTPIERESDCIKNEKDRTDTQRGRKDKNAKHFKSFTERAEEREEQN